ncbi:MAG: hypothetical protein ACREBH_02470 [Candidatus Micrarchaeaceae archaeon]
MKNIYENKHYKFYILIPLVMMLISIYFIPHIQLDSTLRGGITVQVITNSTIDVRTLTSLVDSKIPGAQASVSSSPGGLSITMAENSSMADAQTALLAFYSADGNYSTYTYNVSEYQALLSAQPSNVTLQKLVSSSEVGQQKSVIALNSSLSSELAYLNPFIGNVNYNSSNYANLPNVAKDSYSNASLIYQNDVLADLKAILPFSSYSYNEVTPTLGAFFLRQMEDIIIVALVLVAIVVFFVFRTPVPAFAVIFGAVSDLVVALGAMGAFGIPLGVASVGGLLMLLGFAFDTDILAAVRIIKRSEGTPEERAFSSFKTGTTMTITALISFSILFGISYFAFIPTYVEISGVVLMGLLGDLVATWLADVPIVLWYKKGKGVHR